jgi:hypothetical protein
MGVFIALVLGALMQAIFPAGIVGWVLGVPIAVFALAIGLGLVFGGRKLKQVGHTTSQDATEKALFGLARSRGGILSADDVAQRLHLTPLEADAFMTELAKRGDGKVSLEVDDDGRIAYVFTEMASAAARARFATSSTADRVRVATDGGMVDGAAPVVEEETDLEADDVKSRSRSKTNR